MFILLPQTDILSAIRLVYRKIISYRKSFVKYFEPLMIFYIYINDFLNVIANFFEQFYRIKAIRRSRTMCRGRLFAL